MLCHCPLAWFVFRCSFSRRQRGAPPRKAVYHQNVSIMWPFSLPGGSRGHWDNLLEAILPKEHRDGLASQECHVRHLVHAVQCPSNHSPSRLTALYLATKTTNHPISLESYTANIPRTNASDVLDLEFLVAQSLAFEFAVWHAHRALWGIWLDIQASSVLSIHNRLSVEAILGLTPGSPA